MLRHAFDVAFCYGARRDARRVDVFIFCCRYACRYADFHVATSQYMSHAVTGCHCCLHWSHILNREVVCSTFILRDMRRRVTRYVIRFDQRVATYVSSARVAQDTPCRYLREHQRLMLRPTSSCRFFEVLPMPSRSVRHQVFVTRCYEMPRYIALRCRHVDMGLYDAALIAPICADAQAFERHHAIIRRRFFDCRHAACRLLFAVMPPHTAAAQDCPCLVTTCHAISSRVI